MRRLHVRAQPRRLAALSAVALLAVVAASAQATPPGENGRITFSSDRLGRFEIFSVLPVGGDVRRLTHSGQANAIFTDWSPDGRWIVFDSDRAGDAAALRRVAGAMSSARPPVSWRSWRPSGAIV